METPKTHTGPGQGSDDYDSPWKAALGCYFPAFLALLFPEMHAGIDWTRGYTFPDKELRHVVRDAELGKRHADILVPVHELGAPRAGCCAISRFRASLRLGGR